MKSWFWNQKEGRLRAGIRILCFLLAASLFAIPLSLILESFNEFFENTLTNPFVMVAILLAIWLVGEFIDKRSWKDFGVTLFPIKEFIFGSLMGAVLIGLIFSLFYFFNLVELTEVNYNRLASYPFLLVIIGQLIRYITGSVFEEAFTRGYLLKNVAEGFDGLVSRNGAILIAYIFSSSLFAILHLFNDSASFLSTFNLFLLGLLFGWYVIKTGKLHFAIGLHAAWNIFQNNVFGFPNSGKNTLASFYYYEDAGFPLWTGGEFGPEGGLVCTIIVSLALLFIIGKDLRKYGFRQRVIKE